MKPKPISKRLSAFLLCFALLVGMLPVTAGAATGGFTVSGGTENTDYSYSNGVLTINTSTPLTISTSGQTTTDRIVIGSDVNANLTLNGVNITAPAQTSAIDVPSGASLTLTLANNSTNTLAVSAATTRSLANNAGIHVPEGASLTIQCATASGDNHQYNDACGHLTVTGGEPSGNGFSGAGIGGNGAGPQMSAGGESGENSGTVRINGGNITITGGTSAYPGPGIGGGSGSNGGGDCGEVYITGGIVNIYGGSSNASNMRTCGAAGIGGGNTGMGNSGGSGGIVVITGGTVAVTGGSGTSSGSNSGYGGAGIGGGSSAGSEGAGGNGGTVIILTEVNVKGGQGDSSGSGGTPGNAIGGGFGNSGSNNGDEGDGIRPSTGGNNTYEVYGNLELPDGITIPEGVTVTVPSDSSLTVPEGTELVVNGKLEVENGGSLTNSGTVSGDGTLTGDGTVTNNGGTITVSKNDFAANVTLSITNGTSPVSTVTYGSTVTLTATVTSGDNQPVTNGSVAFSYQLGTGKSTAIVTQNVTNGTATYTINNLSWRPSETGYTITAVYSGGTGLLSGSGTGTLSVSKTTPGATPVGPISSSNRSETSITLNTVSDDNTGTYGPIQYGYTMGSETTPVYWQDSTEFTDLQPGTDYTFYIRYKGNDFYNPSSPGSNTLVVTTNPKITTESLSAGHVGVNYEAQLTASVANGKNVTWSITSGPLPAGLELNGNTISGNPSVAGMSSITVQASIAGDMNGELQVTSTATLYITINQGTSVITAATYNSEIDTNTFTYGDTITVTGTIAASTTAPGTSTNAITQNQVGLYLGETELATANVESGGSFTLKYNTAGKAIPTGQSQTLTVKYGGSSDLNSGETTVSITLNKKPVTVSLGGTTTKVYDGKTTAPDGLTYTVNDTLQDDAVTASGTATYDSAAVGINKTITATGITLSGADVDYYTLSETTATTTGSITQSGSSLTATATDDDLTYGETLTITVTPTQTGKAPTNNALTPLAAGNTVELYKGDTLLAGTSTKNASGTYTLTYETEGKGLAIGSNTLTVQFNGDTNMAASSTTVTVNLSQKSVSATLVGTTTKVYDGKTTAPEGLTIGLSDVETSDDVSATGTIAYASANVGNSITINATGITLSGDHAGYYTLPNSTATTTGSITAAQMTGTVTFDGNAVYNTPLTATYEGNATSVTYQWYRTERNGTTTAISGAAGNTYTPTGLDVDSVLYVIVTAIDTNHTGTVRSQSLTVGKAEQDAPGPNKGYTIGYRAETITADEDYELAETDTADSGSATLTAIPGGTVYVRRVETSTHNPSPWTAVSIPARPAAPDVSGGANCITGVDSTMEYRAEGGEGWTAIPGTSVTGLAPGSYQVRLAATDHAFASAPAAVQVTQYIPPANPNYQITVPPPEHGRVTLDPASAKAGQTVTVTPLPDAGYAVADVAVTDRFGDPVTVTQGAGGTYTFVMPSGQVTVTVTFAEAEAPAVPFTDVAEDDWFHDAVAYAYANGLMDGVGEGRFAPNATTTRAMVVTILYRLAGEPEVTGDLPFLDVETGAWYTEAVAWAAARGIVNGMDEDTFAPNGEITRQQLAAILYRYAAGQGYDVSASADLSGYPDAGQIQAYAQAAMAWAGGTELLRGFEDGTLQPAGNSTRAQIATVLMRFCQSVAG